MSSLGSSFAGPEAKTDAVDHAIWKRYGYEVQLLGFSMPSRHAAVDQSHSEAHFSSPRV